MPTELEKKQKALEEAIANLQNVQSSLDDVIKSRIESGKKELEKEKNKLLKEVGELQRRRDSLSETIAFEFKQAREEIAKKEKDIKALSARLTGQEKQADIVSNHLADKEKKFNAWVEKEEARIVSRENAAKKKDAELDVLEKEIKENRKKIDRALEIALEHNEKSAQLVAENFAIQNEAHNEKITAENLLIKARKEEIRVKEWKQEIENELAERMENAKNYEESVKYFKGEWEEKNKAADILLKSLKTEKAETNEDRDRLKDIDLKLQERERTINEKARAVQIEQRELNDKIATLKKLRKEVNE